MSSNLSDPMQDPKLLRLIWRLGWPAILGLSANAVNQFIDALWVTRYAPAAMAAIGLTFPVLLVVSAVASGMAVATSGELGRRLGRKDALGARRIVGMAMLLAALASAGLAVGLGLWGQPILRWIGGSGDTLPMAHDYLRLMLFFAPLLALQLLCDFTALGAGHSRRAMQALFLGFGLNMLLDPLFIFTFGWGVRGAALATAGGQIAALGLYLIWFRRGTLGVAPALRGAGRSEWRAILRFAPPVTLLNLLTALSFLLILWQAGRLGDDHFIAALSFDLRLVSLVIIPAHGLALGAQAAVSHAHGARDHERAAQLIHRVFALSLSFGVIMMAGLIGARSLLLPLLIPAPQMQAAVSQLLPYFGGYVIGFCLYIPLLTGFQATDHARAAAWVALAPSGYVMLPLTLILPALWGLSGFLWVFPLSGGLTAAIAMGLQLRIRRGAGQPNPAA